MGILTGVQPGIEGLLTGIGSSLHGVGGPSGPTLLADFDFSAPLTSWATGRTGFSSAFATNEWDFQTQTVAGSYDNGVGSATLDDIAGLPDQTAVGIYDGTDMVSRNCWEGLDAANGITCSDTSVGDMNGDLGVRIVFRISTRPASGDTIVAKRDGGAGNAGWSLTLNSTGIPGVTVDGGATTFSRYLATDHCDGAWHCVTFWWDETAGDFFIKSDIDSELSSLGNTESGFASTQALTINNHWPGHTSSAMKHFQVAYLGLAEGANAQSMYDEDFWQHAQDPTGLLTTVSRNSLISVPVSATNVAHFAGGTTPATTQIPIGYSAAFSDTDKLGLYCNSAVTNLFAYSETLATNWGKQFGTATANFADAPDGFRSASEFTATSTGSSAIRLNATVVAETEYTFSGWIKRNGGTDVAGELKVYDITNAAFIGVGQAFTAGSDYALESRTFTTPVGCVSVYCYFSVDTSGDSIIPTMAQLNLGDARGAYIRTNGASAALVYSDYMAAGSAGAYCKGDTGEIESVWISSMTAAAKSNARIWTASTGSNLNNARQELVRTTDAPQVYVYNSTGGAEASLIESGITIGAEYTGLIRWDGGGTLAVGGGVDATYAIDGTAVTDVGTFTGTDTVTEIQLGNYYTPGSSFALDGSIQRIRIWDSERTP